MLEDIVEQGDGEADQIRWLRRSMTDFGRVYHHQPGVDEESNLTMEYADKRVNKPWGSEYQLYAGGDTAIWILSLDACAQTSMHCHRFKTTTLIVLSGEVICSTLLERVSRRSGQVLVFEAGVFHRTQAHGEGQALVMEIETPPAKHDLFRIDDAYGREGLGYESVAEHRAMAARTTIFPGDCSQHTVRRNFGALRLEILAPASDEGMRRVRQLRGSEMIILLEGRDLQMADGLALGAGACCRASALKDSVKWHPASVLAILDRVS